MYQFQRNWFLSKKMCKLIYLYFEPLPVKKNIYISDSCLKFLDDRKMDKMDSEPELQSTSKSEVLLVLLH